jgi:hypothetical protein
LVIFKIIYLIIYFFGYNFFGLFAPTNGWFFFINMLTIKFNK